MIDRDRLLAIRDGRERPDALASIVIPHYQTPELVRLCLRAIRRLTDHPYEVLVVDNHSTDGSVEVLRGIRWIRLIERGPETEPEAARAHATAMDLGMEGARGRWLVSFHTDTIVRREGWLGALLGRLKADPYAAALGAGKMDYDPGWYRALKRLWDERRIKAFLRRLVGMKPKPELQTTAWYPRSYCAIYDLDRVRALGLTFQPDASHPTGSLLYHGLVAAGHTGVRLSAEEMHAYVDHVAHATALLGRGGLDHWRGNQKVKRMLRRVMHSDLARDLMDDASLDR